MKIKAISAKLLSLFMLLAIFTIPFNQTTAASTFRVYATSKTTNYVDAVRHIQIIGTIDYNGTVSNQVINYAAVNLKDFPDIQVVVGDNYKDNGFGMSNLLQQIINVESRYKGSQVLAGVNGDFYNMSNGIPISPFVRNYEVIYEGATLNRTLVGFKDDGSVVIGKPEFEGYEVMVYDADGSLKLNQIKVAGFNRLPANESETTVLFDDYKNLIDSPKQKLVINGSDVKTDGSGSRYFAKGMKSSITTDAISVPENQFVIMGNKIFESNFITDTDTVVIQRKLTGKYEGVRHGIGGWELLVVDGKTTTTFTEGASYQYRAPRTAIGVKRDGTVFFVTVDGRNMPTYKDGVTGYEMAEIMAYFEAYQAVNLDGGGSTTMALLNDLGEFDIVNTPSDGHLRTNANGVFFVKGRLAEPMAPIPFPDTRTILSSPAKILFENGQLSFSEVEHASKYEIRINGADKIFSESNSMALDLPLGEHTIEVRAFGNHEMFKQSVYATTYQFHAYSNEMLDIIEFLKSMTQAGSTN